MSESGLGKPTDDSSCTDKDLSCPTCGRSDFKNERGMKVHHKRTHGVSVTVTKECQCCDEPYEVMEANADQSTFCSSECQHEWQSDNWNGENHHNYSSVVLVCGWCEAEYKRPPSQADNSTFCSVRCKSEWQSEHKAGENNPNWDGGKVNVECEICGGTYPIRPSRQSESRCCSTSCLSEWKRENQSGENHPSWKGGLVSVDCEVCGATVERKQNEYEKYENHFCSQDCRATVHAKRFNGEDHPNYTPNKVEKRFYQSPEWKAVRQEALERAGGECEACGVSNALVGHHIIPLSDGGAPLDVDNVTILCRSCHGRWEGLYLRPDTRG